MKVLIVEPMKPCYVREVSGLKAMQEVVGGDIEATYPFEEAVAVVCNANGKGLGLPYDIVCGTFFLAGLGAEDFVSLTEEQIRRYKELFDSRILLTVPAQSQPGESHAKKGKAHER